VSQKGSIWLLHKVNAVSTMLCDANCLGACCSRARGHDAVEALDTAAGAQPRICDTICHMLSVSSQSPGRIGLPHDTKFIVRAHMQS
jgi:hypothetical protein